MLIGADGLGLQLSQAVVSGAKAEAVMLSGCRRL